MIFLVFNFLEIQIILNTVTQSSGSQIAAKGMSELQVQIQIHVINILCPSAITVKFAEMRRLISDLKILIWSKTEKKPRLEREREAIRLFPNCYLILLSCVV